MILTSINHPKFIMIEPVAPDHTIVIWCSPDKATDWQMKIDDFFSGVQKVNCSRYPRILAPAGPPYFRLSIIVSPEQEIGPLFDKIKRWLSGEAIVIEYRA